MSVLVPPKGLDIRFIGPVVGRYVLESRLHLPGVRVFACRLQSISPFQMIVSVPVPGSVDENVTASFEPFGRLRTRIVRQFEGGFAAEIGGDRDDRGKLASRIEWYKKRTFTGLTDKRRHRRYMPREPRSAIVLADGDVLPCLVIDMSASGVAVSADHDPAPGEPLAVGRMVGRVVRRLDVGFAVQFIEPSEIEIVEEMLRAPPGWEGAQAAEEFGGDACPADISA
jgi:hypothetical protein